MPALLPELFAPATDHAFAFAGAFADDDAAPVPLAAAELDLPAIKLAWTHVA